MEIFAAEPEASKDVASTPMDARPDRIDWQSKRSSVKSGQTCSAHVLCCHGRLVFPERVDLQPAAFLDKFTSGAADAVDKKARQCAPLDWSLRLSERQLLSL